MSSTPRGQLTKRPNPSQDLSISNKRQKRPSSVYKQVILDEDEYTEALERIIRRDFFPDLDAVERELERREKAARREAEYTGPTPQTRTQQQQRDWTRHGSAATPAAGTEFGETPGHTPLRSSTAQHSEEPSPTASYDHLSLTEFLNTYTSEDNASFAEILQRNNETRRQKNAWAFVGEAAANASAQASRDKRHRLIEAVKLAVESSEDGSVKMIEGAEPGRPGERLLLEPGRDSIVADKSSVQNAKNRITAPETSSASAQLLIEGSPSTKTENQEGQLIKPQEESKLSSEAPVARTSQQSKLEGKDAGMVESWPYTARNGFMFPPDANFSLTAPRPKALDPKEADRLGIQAPKAISHANTRIAQPETSSSSSSVPASPTHSNIAAAIGGTPYPGREGLSDTPRVGGYSFVDAVPSPTPDQLGKGGMKQLMTYGKLGATPVPLTEVKEGPFKIPQTPHREQLALNMARKASKSLAGRHGVQLPTLAKDAAKRLGLTPKDQSTPFGGSMKGTPRGSSTPTSEGLSPAAKSLLGKTGQGRSVLNSARGSGAFDAVSKSKEAKQREAYAKKRLEAETWEP